MFRVRSRGTTSESNFFTSAILFPRWPPPILKLVCTLSPDCSDRLSSNFVQSLILLTGGSLLILGKNDLKHGYQRRFFNMQLNQCDAIGTTRHTSHVSNIFPLYMCFSRLFYPIENIFAILPKKTVVINFDILLTQYLSTLWYIITAKPLDISSSGFLCLF